MSVAFDAMLETRLADLRDQGLLRRLPELQSAQGPRSTINGSQVINLSSNNYLGLATHPALKAAAIAATEALGVGSGAVRTIIGTLTIHEDLERLLAEFKHTEATLVLQSGFTANAAVLGCILEEGDLVISDALNHASIIDGVRLTKATRRVYAHSDMDDLERVLEETKDQGFNQILIVTDGVFSMDGDIAPLPRIAELARHYGAITMVDDAHASGVLGAHGAGTVSHFGITDWDVQVGTLSKAVGVLGGYVACVQPLRTLMEHRARPFLFSTSHPPAVTAACIAAIELLQSAEGQLLIDQLWANTQMFKQGLESLGFNTGISETPITPVIVGDGARTMQFSDALFQAGVFAQGIAFPTVARDKGRVRTIVTATHSPADLEEALTIFETMGRRMQLI